MADPFPIEPHELFNRKLQDFLEDLSPLLGHLPDFKVVVKSVRLLGALDARQNHVVFERYVGPYEQRIMARDERFFMNECDSAYRDAAEYMEASAGLVPMLKQVWRSLTPGDRDAVWAHLNVLLILSRRTAEARHARGVAV